MKKIKLHIIALAALLFAYSGSLIAQWSIRGNVRIGAEGLPATTAIINASYPPDYTESASPNSEGVYFLAIPEGTTVTLIASLTGYSNIEMNIVVASGGNWMNFWFDPPLLPSDFDGNYYKTVEIGSQIWMAENLKTTHYSDGTNIPQVFDNTIWSGLNGPAYCWYDNNWSLYKDTYGALYNWYTVNTGNLCPDGWHVPIDAEWTTLTTSLGGESIAGDKLKEAGFEHWELSNEGATNETGFTALPGGYRNMYDGHFVDVGHGGLWWSATMDGAADAWYRYMVSNLSGVYRTIYNHKEGFSVRCINDVLLPTVSTSEISTIIPISALSGGDVTSNGGSAFLVRGICWSTSENPTIEDNKASAGSGTGSFTCNATNLDPNTTYYVRAYATNSVGTSYGNQVDFITSAAFDPILFNSDFTYGSVTDIDGNLYKTIQIGSQLWMAENLKTTKLNNSTEITQVTDNTQWSTLTDPGYCWYKNDAVTYENTFGALYNWYTVNTGYLCPTGWHVPSQTDWTTMRNSLGGTGEQSDVGGKLKEAGITHWSSPNTGADNLSGFTALPGGNRGTSDFLSIGQYGSWWSSTQYDMFDAWGIHLHYNSSILYLDEYNFVTGRSVRCVYDVLLPTVTTAAISDITPISALSGGNVTSDGGAALTARGVCWSTSPSPTVDLPTKTWNGGIIGIFSSNIIGLNPGTTYYLRAYATNSAGTAYGNEIVFTTQAPTSFSVIEGYVKFGPIRDVMPGTTIQIKDSPFGGTINGDGLYQISDVPTGAIVTLSVALAGYTRNERTILIKPGTNIANFWIDAVTDPDGNSYSAVEIGTQVWIAENLKTTKYSNGTDIPLVKDSIAWSDLATPGYCWYYNDPSTYKANYGALYNWYTVMTGNLCPTGWHVPDDNETRTLIDYLGGGSVAGGKLKESGLAHWTFPNEGATNECATNESGFSALPGGMRLTDAATGDGMFSLLGSHGYWWSASEQSPYQNESGDGCDMFMHYTMGSASVGIYFNEYGMSVRCVKDNILVVTNIDDNTDPGSLRRAIIDANSTTALDKITFNIPGKGPFIIKLKSALPAITNGPLVIDGFTQPGSSAATSTMLIELDGTDAGTESNGLTIEVGYLSSARNCVVKGLVINKFSGNGIQISSGTRNTISANSIYNNGGLGIDLGSKGSMWGGVSLNDVDKAPSDHYGPNNVQNFPVLDKIVFSLGEVYISGHLNSIPGKNYTLEFFASKLADNNEYYEEHYGEGDIYLGSTTVTTEADGNVFFTDITFLYKTLYGDVITATATDQDGGNTSEFSLAVGGLPDQKLNNIALVYNVNPNDARIDPNSIIEAVKSSFNTWNGITTANIAFNYGSTTTEKYAHIDGENVVSFSDDEYLFGDWVLAITAKTLQLGATDAETKILDADIIFNPYFVNHKSWNFGIADDMLNAGYFDIQSITTHEIGHILGLLHSGVHNATMWFEMGQGIDARSLEQDDKSWASYKYPEPGNNFGSISGNIKYGYDDTKHIVGAIVLAINTATRDTVHSYSDVNGNYLVPGLSAGSYNVYIEPLDGDVYGRPLYPRNISLYIYCNTIYTDYPGEFYSGTDEKAEETQDIVTPVTVNAESETSGKNFVTNKDITPPAVVSVSPPDISISPDIIIKFSEPVDIGSFSNSTCYLVKSGDTKSIGGSYITLGDQTHIVLFTPEEALNYNTRYTLHITTGVTDLALIRNNLLAEYQFTFKTGQDDKKPPTIVDIIPENGATNVFVNQKIMVFFSEPMNKTSVESSFSINPAVGHTFSWDNENKILTFVHASSFGEGTTYSITVSSGAKDLSGNAMASSVSISFTTVPAADPTIDYLEPGKLLKTDITVTTPIVADFSEPIDTLTVNSSTFKLLKGVNNGVSLPGRFEFLNDNSRVVFRPDAALEFSQTNALQTYTIVLTDGIKDVSQNVGSYEGLTTTFTTATKPGKPQIDFIDPPSGIVEAEVTIGGKGFDPDPVKNKVGFYFDGVTFIEAKVISASLTSLTVQVPLGAKSGQVHVTVNGATDDPLVPFDFYVVQEYSDPCNEVLGNANTGGNSRAVALDISGATAYITNSGSNNVTVIDVAKLTTLKTIDVGEYPLMIDINPEGTKAYVTNFRSHTVSVIDLATKAVTKTINVGYNPYGIAVSPDGKRVYVAHYNSEYENVSVIDADPASGGFDHVVSNINTGTRNRNLDIDPNASMIVVTGDDGLKIIERIKTEFGFDYATTNASSGTKTRDVAIITEAGLAVVSTMDGNLLFIGITKGTETFGAVVANSSSGAKAGGVKPDFSGVFLYVTNPYDNQVTVYKMTYGGSGSEIGSYQGFKLTEYWTIPVGISPEGLIINTFNDQLLVVNALGETGSTGSVTKVKICCAGKSPSDDIVAVALYIQGMINSGAIKKTDGKMLINKLNDALSNIARGKTKTAINDLNTFINKVNSLVKTGKINNDQGQKLIDDVNAIIRKLKGLKSDETESNISDTGFSQPVQISESKLGVIYPNPFSESITINYEIAESKESANNVLIRVYDISGRLVSNLVDKTMQSGRYTTFWKGNYDRGGPAPYGTYFVLFRTGNVEEVKEIMLVR